MKFKHTVKNYSILLIAPVLHIPLWVIAKICWFIGAIGDWIWGNICSNLPRLDIDYSEEIKKAEDEFLETWKSRGRNDSR